MTWNQLKDIKQQNRETVAAERREGPLSCPIDGELLDIRGNIRNCPLGNYRWEAGAGKTPAS
tara:strand:+ start:1387 stop:1572 length:186 start_codon:yes stop_codon:yes gene_type:complete